MGRYSAATALVATAPLLAACSAGSGAGPLGNGTAQEGVRACVSAPAPKKYAYVGIPAWNSPVGYALDWYYNTSASPIEIESVSLIDAHNVVLNGAIVYEMRHSEHPLPMEGGWMMMGRYAYPSAWAHRQSVPGAVILPAGSTIGTPGPNARLEYQVVLDISAKTPAGGYAIGHQVTYRQGSAQYTIRTYTGYAIVPPGSNCQAQDNAIAAAWPKP